jgi:medium-chain acyl-[acyl-carrier-protein] hydrolase
MRADVKVVENYRYRDIEPFSCPILAIGGTDAGATARIELEAWKAHSKNECAVKMIAGDHFFLRARGYELIQTVREAVLGKHASIFGDARLVASGICD